MTENPLTDPGATMGGPKPVMDAAKTTHEDAVPQEYAFGANTRSQSTEGLSSES